MPNGLSTDDGGFPSATSPPNYTAGPTPRSAHFSLSMSSPPSEASSRASSPGPDDFSHYDEKQSRLPPSPLNARARSGDDQESYDSDPSPGQLPKDVYEATLSWWRASLRRKLVETVKVESVIIARMQKKIRTPWLDAYFVYTSSLGTHTFFMILLPAFFFFGHNDIGFGLLFVLAAGVYFSSFIKDLLCSPRPFAPPVTRLTIGSHHLEYGFPSTHSTNSVSIALFFFSRVYDLAFPPPSQPAVEPSISLLTFSILSGFLAFYTFSIVYGRLYTAMHSFTDCAMGVFLGTAIWWAQTSWGGIPVQIAPENLLYIPLGYFSHFLSSILPQLFSFSSSSLPSFSYPAWLDGATPLTLHIFPGFGITSALETYVQTHGWQVPLLLVPITLLAVNQHPQPVDDCPCFEDAIAFVSVVAGAALSRWGVSFFWERPYGFENHTRTKGPLEFMPGSGWTSSLSTSNLTSAYTYTYTPPTPTQSVIWLLCATVKMVVGIMIIFVWRIAAKSVLHVVLPPTFRVLSKVFELPRRRFYTPATEYERGRVPFRFWTTAGTDRNANGNGTSDRDQDARLEEKGLTNGKKTHGVSELDFLPTIPSVIDLPTTVELVPMFGEEETGVGSAVRAPGRHHHHHSTSQHTKNTKRKPNGFKQDEKTGGGFGSETESSSGDVTTDASGKAKDVKHYDADVLTKVIVYAGIAALSAEVIPILFETVGLGVVSNPPAHLVAKLA